MTSGLLKTLLLLALCNSTVSAQGLALTLTPGHQMRIEGTSNLRNWGADINQIETELVLSQAATAADLRPEMFKRVHIKIPVAGISSGTRGLSGKIHKYLKKKEHPVISFALEQIVQIEHTSDSALITAQGIINAAGKDHPVIVQVKAQDAAGHLAISGTLPLTMTSFGIKPPTVLFGRIKATDEFQVNFNLLFSR